VHTGLVLLTHCTRLKDTGEPPIQHCVVVFPDMCAADSSTLTNVTLTVRTRAWRSMAPPMESTITSWRSIPRACHGRLPLLRVRDTDPSSERVAALVMGERLGPLK
jgi:hypothetical protein